MVSKIRFNANSRPLESNHSCKVCAPPPDPPPRRIRPRQSPELQDPSIAEYLHRSRPAGLAPHSTVAHPPREPLAEFAPPAATPSQAGCRLQTLRNPLQPA